MKYYNKNSDFSTSKNSSENNDKNGNENTINLNPFQKYNNDRVLNKNAYKDKEENNSKEEIIQINNEDKCKQYGGGKYRFINTKAEKEKRFKKKNIYNKDNINYSTQNTNDKTNNNNSNKITNNICIIINKPEDKQNKNNFDYLNFENQNKNENITFNSNNKNKSYDFRNLYNNNKTPIRNSDKNDNNNKNPYLDTEPNKRDKIRNLYKIMSSDVNRNTYNKSYSSLIEEKRILLGIPTYKTEFQKDNTITNTNIKDDIVNQEKKSKIKVIKYKRRQDEVLGNDEKKNVVNKRTKDCIKNNSHKKNPIRIIYDDININNIFDNDKGLDKNNYRLNSSCILKDSYLANHNRRNYNSQDNKPNKTHDVFKFQDEDIIYLKNKIQFYRQKEKENKLKKLITNTNPRTIKELVKFKNSPFKKKETPENKKVYDNNSYNSKILTKLINNGNENESHKNISIKTSNYNKDNKKIKNLSNSTKYKKRNINLNLNTYNPISTYIPKPIIYSFPIQNNNGNDMQVLKKRHKSITIHVERNSAKHKKINEIKKLEKEQSKFPTRKKYENNVIRPGRAISALRRINQTIENYKKGINSNEENLKMKINNIKLYA